LSGALGLSEGGLLGLLGIGGAASADFDAFGGIGAAASSGGGLFTGLFSALGSIFAFRQGGIVPSAAGGWVVPQLGPGGVPAMLHSQEMVLPANISQGLQGMIANGGAASTGPINFSVSALDAQSVAKFFQSNGAVLVAALNKALRNGSSLYAGALG
jgi:hypothetical protein